MAARTSVKLEARMPKGRPLAVRASLVGERLHLRGLEEPAQPLGPLVLAVGRSGLAALFRYGVVVFFNVSEAEQRAFLLELRGRIEQAMGHPETEEATLRLAAEQPEGITPEGILLADFSMPRLQLVAIALARSVVLAYYERTVAAAFDLVEPLARELEAPREGLRRMRALRRQIGGALLAQHSLIGRVEIADKPDVLWDRPDLERLHLRLENEYELPERSRVLERKLVLINRTAETAVEVLQNRSMLRVEWYIVLLIVVEVALYIYDITNR